MRVCVAGAIGSARLPLVLLVQQVSMAVIHALHMPSCPHTSDRGGSSMQACSSSSLEVCAASMCQLELVSLSGRSAYICGAESVEL